MCFACPPIDIEHGHILLAATELWDRPSKLLWALFLKLHAKTIVFTPMDTRFINTYRRWCMFSSELRSVRSLRRFPSFGTEYAAVVSRVSVAQLYTYIGSCINVRWTCPRSFSFVSFTQLKKVFTKLTCLAVDVVYYYSYFIHSCCHSHTLTIATGRAHCNKPV